MRGFASRLEGRKTFGGVLPSEVSLTLIGRTEPPKMEPELKDSSSGSIKKKSCAQLVMLVAVIVIIVVMIVIVVVTTFLLPLHILVDPLPH